MIDKLKEYKKIIFDLIKLSLPILGGNLSQILISFTDTIVAGRYSTTALGAISVASAIIMTITIGAIGLILAVSPVLANYRGQKIPAKRYFKSTLLFACLVSIPFFILIEIFLANIDIVGFSQDLIVPTRQYIEICAWTILPVCIFVALKEYLQAFEKVIYANILMFISILVNIFLDIILTFGVNFDYNFIHIHFEPMGIIGLSIATLVSKIVATILILLYCLPLFKTKYEKSVAYIKELFKVGIPIASAIFFEFLGFNLTAVLIGKFGAVYAGVHNIILCIANFTFMIVLSVSNATSIKVGYYNGANDKLNIIRYSISNIILVLCVCFTTFVLLGLYSPQIISIFSNDLKVIELSGQIIKFAMIFLFFDGIQGACVGILKGLKDTKIIAYTMLFVYVIVAIPIGSYFAFQKGMILSGFWFGLSLALFLASIITSVKVIIDIKRIKN